MPLIFKENKEKQNQGILSATRPKDITLSINKSTNKDLQILTRQKIILTVYIDKETNKMFVDTSTAYALGASNIRAIMTGNERLVEITYDNIEKYKNRFPNIEIETNKVILEPKVKEKIKLYYTKENKFYIDFSAAYALNLISNNIFYDQDSKYYGPLAEFEINFIKNKYDIELHKIEIIENLDNDLTRKESL